MIESRAFDNDHRDPVVVVVATGTHDVSRLVNALAQGNCEQVDFAAKITAQLRRHNAGRAALKLLREHGGPDFTGEPPTWPPIMAAREVNQLFQDGGTGVVGVAREIDGKLDWLALNEGAAPREAQPFLEDWPNLLVVATPWVGTDRMPMPPQHRLRTRRAPFHLDNNPTVVPVAGHCPACDDEALVVSSGRVMCSSTGCPDSWAVHDWLHARTIGGTDARRW